MEHVRRRSVPWRGAPGPTSPRSPGARGRCPPGIRLHDLRHTHASLLLAKCVPVKVVSERLGHSGPTVTLTVYAHVMPGNQRDAADLFARLISEAKA